MNDVPESERVEQDEIPFQQQQRRYVRRYRSAEIKLLQSSHVVRTRQ